jgi:hypothetical protein
MRPSLRLLAPALVALTALLVPATAPAASPFTEQRAQATWSISFTCPDGSTASDGRLFIETDNFIDPGATAGPTAPLRVAFSGQCPDGTFSWGFFAQAPTQFDANNLKSVVIGTTTGTARDNRGGTHTISVSVSWTGTSALQTTVNTAGSKSKKRTGTATATIVFDGSTLVNGAANFPFPAPFIEVDTEK